MDSTNSTVTPDPQSTTFQVARAGGIAATYRALRRAALLAALPLAVCGPQRARARPELLDDPVGHLHGYVLGQALHTAAAVCQRLLL